MTNDKADYDLVERIFASAATAGILDLTLDKMNGNFVAAEIERGFALAEASPATWQLFLQHEFWTDRPKQKPRPSDQETAMRFVLRIFYGERTSGTKRANEVWTAVQQLNRESLSPAQILAEFRTGLGKQGMDMKAVCKRAADHNRTTLSHDSAAQAEPSTNSTMAERKAAVASNDKTKKLEVGAPGDAINKQKGQIQLILVDATGALAALPNGTKFEGKFEVIDGLTVKFIKMKNVKSK